MSPGPEEVKEDQLQLKDLKDKMLLILLHRSTKHGSCHLLSFLWSSFSTMNTETIVPLKEHSDQTNC